MAKANDILESKQNLKILPVFVTIDPQRDTPAQLRAYLEEFNSRIVGLTGPVAAIRKMAQEYRVYFKKSRLNLTKTVRKFSIDSNLTPTTGSEFHSSPAANVIKHDEKVDEESVEGAFVFTSENFDKYAHQ
ncbi:protein SCO1 homolog 2, mitochondrial-like isoform X3 [Vicia villosa]|uniref:protein SCO1 homolog 2, mitochondrial-like isoform X3 n=1 Tax=Vicia villosa TaxID=3911 RepID=UPI00273C15DC|nr:protein SCO1 homolog 2, mitochondrial-like isoform X3 [Vicia villosa]XP_058738555.1 protein SCO1 homolog 2, mitochondrial-like isoform X3 [Vicia villosa]